MFRKLRKTNYALLAIFICLVFTSTAIFRSSDHVRFVPPLIDRMVLVNSYTPECMQIAEPAPPKTIPKIIHQVWNNEILPNEFIKDVKSLVRDNPYPEWEYYFWTRESGTKFLMDKYPYLLERFDNDSITSDTMRADMLRIVAIHEYGGVYFDLDTMSVRPLATFVDSHECSVAKEPTEHFFGQKLDLLLTNSALLCRKGHPFFKMLLHKLATIRDDCLNAFLCTGPQLLTPLYKAFNKSRGDAVALPDIQSSTLFQDHYDVKNQTPFLYLKCGNLTEAKLTMSPFLYKGCLKWHKRGRENRTLSESAFTYHEWFHVYGKELEESPTNSVSNIIPHAKIYGVNL